MLTFDASIVGVGCEALWAELALGHVVLDDAGSPVGTGQSLAGVPALELDAGHVRRAPLVLEADADFGAAALVADADGGVVLDVALLARRARGPGARVLAGAGHAGLADRALRVSGAPAHRPRGAGQLAEGVDDQLGLALAAGLMVGGHALLVGLADGGVAAGGGAPARFAVQVGGAVAVGLAAAVGGAGGGLGLAPQVEPAADVGLARVALGALAAGEVVDDAAEGVLAAGGAEGARVDALAGFAELVQRTVRVDSARN